MYVAEHAKYAIETMRKLNINKPNETPDDLVRKEIPDILGIVEQIREERQKALDEVEALIENLNYVFEMLEIRNGDPIMVTDLSTEQQAVPNLSALLNEYNTLAKRGFENIMTPTECDRMLQLEELMHL